MTLRDLEGFIQIPSLENLEELNRVVPWDTDEEGMEIFEGMRGKKEKLVIQVEFGESVVSLSLSLADLSS